MALVEVSILETIVVLQIDDQTTVRDLSNAAYNEYKASVSRNDSSAQRSASWVTAAARIACLKDGDGRVLSNSLKVLENRLHQRRLVVVLEPYSDQDLVNADDVEAVFRDWQLWGAQQVFRHLDADSLGILDFAPGATAFRMILELRKSPTKAVQLSCLQSLLLVCSRCRDEKVVESCVSTAIELFHDTNHVDVCLEILTQFNRMFYRGIVFTDGQIDTLLERFDLESALLRFPEKQSEIFALFDTLTSSNRSSERLNALERQNKLKTSTTYGKLRSNYSEKSKSGKGKEFDDKFSVITNSSKNGNNLSQMDLSEGEDMLRQSTLQSATNNDNSTEINTEDSNSKQNEMKQISENEQLSESETTNESSNSEIKSTNENITKRADNSRLLSLLSSDERAIQSYAMQKLNGITEKLKFIENDRSDGKGSDSTTQIQAAADLLATFLKSNEDFYVLISSLLKVVKSHISTPKKSKSSENNVENNVKPSRIAVLHQSKTKKIINKALNAEATDKSMVKTALISLRCIASFVSEHSELMHNITANDSQTSYCRAINEYSRLLLTLSHADDDLIAENSAKLLMSSFSHRSNEHWKTLSKDGTAIEPLAMIEFCSRDSPTSSIHPPSHELVSREQRLLLALSYYDFLLQPYQYLTVNIGNHPTNVIHDVPPPQTFENQPLFQLLQYDDSSFVDVTLSWLTSRSSLHIYSLVTIAVVALVHKSLLPSLLKRSVISRIFVFLRDFCTFDDTKLQKKALLRMFFVSDTENIALESVSKELGVDILLVRIILKLLSLILLFQEQNSGDQKIAGNIDDIRKLSNTVIVHTSHDPLNLSITQSKQLQLSSIAKHDDLAYFYFEIISK